MPFLFSFMIFIPGYSGYAILGSQSCNVFNGLAGSFNDGAVFIVLPFLLGITTTLSPSKSAPDNFGAIFGLITTQSLGVLPNIAIASLFLLFTIRSGISEGPECGYLTRQTCSPSLKFGA